MNKDFLPLVLNYIQQKEKCSIYYFLDEIELPALSRQYLDNPHER